MADNELALVADGGAHMVAGTMPRWLQNVHKLSFVMMTLLFAGLGWLNLRSFFGVQNIQARNGIILVTVWLIIIVLAGFGMLTWYWRRLIREFSYDRGTLQLSTLGRPDTVTRSLLEIVEVSEWRGRGGILGYRIKLRGGAKFFLQNGVSNATVLAEQIRSDLRMQTWTNDAEE